MRDYTVENPEFSEKISIVEEDDLVNDENDTAAAKQLLENTLVNANNIAEEVHRAKNREDEMENSFTDEAQAIRMLIDLVYANANGYTDNKISQLINGAPTTLDTLGEIAKAMQDNENVVDALEQAIGKKANAVEFDNHKNDATIHITTTERNTWNSKQDPTGDAKDNTVTFTSDDTENPTSWTSMVLFKSKEKLSSILNKVSIMAKNVRYLYKMLGTEDISSIGNGTVTGALSQINSNIGNLRLIQLSTFEDTDKTITANIGYGVNLLLGITAGFAVNLLSAQMYLYQLYGSDVIKDRVNFEFVNRNTVKFTAVAGFDRVYAISTDI